MVRLGGTTMNDAMTADDATDFDAARAACRRRARAAFYISHSLPPYKRQGLWAVIAGGHMIRDAIAPATSAGSDCCSGGGGMLERVRERIDRMYGNTLELPLAEFRDETQRVLSAMAQTVRRFEIPRAAMSDFLEGCAAEAGVKRYATWSALQRHCDSVGGSIARMIACVLGVTHSDASESIVAAGRAGRLIEILRSLKADAARDRVYLPLEDMIRCRYGERDLLSGVADERFARLIAIEVERARESLRRAADGVCWLAGDGARIAAAAHVAMQLAMLEEIERSTPTLLHRPPSLAAARVLRRLPGAWRLARRQSDEPEMKFR
jgi:phytoene synthase